MRLFYSYSLIEIFIDNEGDWSDSYISKSHDDIDDYAMSDLRGHISI